jgi:hypothetical protein
VNEFVKRARAAKIHAYIVSSLRARMPFMGKAKVQQQIVDNLEEEFDRVSEATGSCLLTIRFQATVLAERV